MQSLYSYLVPSACSPLDYPLQPFRKDFKKVAAEFAPLIFIAPVLSESAARRKLGLRAESLSRFAPKPSRRRETAILDGATLKNCSPTCCYDAFLCLSLQLGLSRTRSLSCPPSPLIFGTGSRNFSKLDFNSSAPKRGFLGLVLVRHLAKGSGLSPLQSFDLFGTATSSSELGFQVVVRFQDALSEVLGADAGILKEQRRLNVVLITEAPQSDPPSHEDQRSP